MKKSDLPAWKTWAAPEPDQSMRSWHDARCAVCGSQGALVVDHCHRTGLVRGLLCRGCNTSEGHGTGIAWDDWRTGDNPAHAHGWYHVYFNHLDQTPLFVDAELSFYSLEERVAYWLRLVDEIPKTGEWPTDAPVTDASAARRRQQWDEMRDALQKVSDFLGLSNPSEASR